MTLEERFVAKEFDGTDDKTWWRVFDNATGNWSTFECHDKYDDKLECEAHIHFWNGYYGEAKFAQEVN